MRRTRLNSSVDSVFEIPRRSILNQMNHWTGGQIADEINDYLSETNPDIRVTNAFFTGNTLGIEYTAPDQDEAEDAFYYVLSDRYTPINSSRRSLKTQRAIRHSINSARRRANLNCGVTRYADDEEYQTYYFITDDNSLVASFDVEIHEDVIEFAGFMRGYSAGGYVVNENSVFGDFAPGTNIAKALADFVYDKTGVDVYETEDAKEFINHLRNINTVFINSRRASLKSARRLNSGKLFYDDATGEYEEYEYDDEQDAWYQLPDEMYIFKLDLSQFIDLVRDGVVSKHEIHEWIDELSEDWGGMPAWSPAKLLDRFEIQDLTKEQYDTWKANFAAELARFADAVARR